jgi:glycosyltransferase involved in cell wall biosynthesis
MGQKMITDKILIFYHYGPGINGGGPMGFVNQNIEGVKSKYFITPNQISSEIKKYSYPRIFYNYIKSKRNPNWDIENDLKACEIPENSYWLNMIKSSVRKFKEIEAWKYKFIYFHDMYTMKACLHLLKDNQTVMFQPHSPEKMSMETHYFTDSNDDYNWAVLAEKDVFSRSNIVVLPNEYTQEIYSDVISNTTQIKFLISGCSEPKKNLNYPLDSQNINILYIGRRTKIKGFDIALDAFKKIREKRKDINLLLLGNGEFVTQDGVWDLGFSNTPHNWINSVDYVISTNVQSYFDLAIMETLAVGTPILMTSGQGHKMFIEDNSLGIIDLGEPNSDNIASKIISLHLKKRIDNHSLIASNKNLYNLKYSKENYIIRLENFCKELLNA